MLSRICRAAAMTAAGLLALIGLLVYPSQLLATVGVAVLFVGPLTTMCVLSTAPQRGVAPRLGALTAAATVLLGLVVAGLVATLGAAAGVVIVLLLIAAGVWASRRGRPWKEQVLTWARSRPGSRAADPAGIPRQAPRPLPTPTGPARVTAGPVSTAELCVTWRRTYWVLLDLPPTGPERDLVIDARRRLLNELERRDPVGFARWMQTEPRACSDPGRYLTADH